MTHHRPMLSRTADNLYWLARYVERADGLARLLEATQRVAALPQSYGVADVWENALVAAGCADAFHAHYGEATEESVVGFLAFSTRNPSSIRNCFEVARTNARAVRTALTVEMWDAINGAWLELKRFEGAKLGREETTRFLDWVKESVLRFDGSGFRTMLRNDAYWFTRLGVQIERADNTARLIGAKHQVLAPSGDAGTLDYFQSASILRTVSALTAYHWVYRDSVKPHLVADLLILNDQVPRSLARCYAELVRHLDELASAYGRGGDAQQLARDMRARLVSTRLDDVFGAGLAAFSAHFIVENNRLGSAIGSQYLV